MLQPIRFTTTEPGKLSTELDRLVRDLQRELVAARLSSGERWAPQPTVNGIAGQTVVAKAKPGDLLPVNSALGAVDVALPTLTPGEAARSVLVLRSSTLNAVTLRSTRPINAGATSVALPGQASAFLAVWDGASWWTVNGAP
jgi:hypothetical protein